MDKIQPQIALLNKTALTGDTRHVYRVLQSLSGLRKNLSAKDLTAAVTALYPNEHRSKQDLLKILSLSSLQRHNSEANGNNGDVMEVDEGSGKDGETNVPTAPSTTISDEVDIYVRLLLQILILDARDLQTGAQYSLDCIKRLQSVNKRSLDPLGAKLYFYFARFCEQLGQLSDTQAMLLAAERTATIRHDNECLATLITILLRSYIADNRYDQADRLISKTVFPSGVSNNTHVRYLYYLGRIHAVQLNYSSAHEDLSSAIREAPNTPAAAGILQAIHKLHTIVELLMGDLPDLATFRVPMLERALGPYAQIVRAVRVGDLTAFSEAITQHVSVYKRDATLSLILRLRQNVIKTGLRMISLSYSRISMKDICLKLGLDSEWSAEYIVAKAIRDGVIDAWVDHERGHLESKEVLDVYGTEEPMVTFNERIQFCLNLRNESVKAMRYPENINKDELANTEALREREKEIAREIADGDLDDDEDFAGGDFL